MNLEPIAIVGIGCRFPGAINPEAFWQLLCHQIDAIAPIPSERQHLHSCIPNSTSSQPQFLQGGFLEQIDQFDPQFFGIAPQEAISIDPQQRLLLEVIWEALEDAGFVPQKLSGTTTGVFVGIAGSDYYELLADVRTSNAYAVTGNLSNIAANRISYTFNFTGPSLAINTACSSSLVAVHLACQSLRSRESSLALAAGANIMLFPEVTASLKKAGMISTTERCRAFDAQADGFVRGEGVGVVVLKLLSQAVAECDFIYAVIRGSAVNQDGRTNGLAAPNLQAQQAVLQQAYQNAEVSPSSVQYLEAQGTGTILGDAIELKAIASILGANRPLGDNCRVASVKTNIGHLEAASGIAGLIKVALSLNYGKMPPNLHFQQPNPNVALDKLSLQVQQTLEPWPRNRPGIAGVSAFGFGGTNAHVVMAAASNSVVESSQVNRPLHVLTLSAKTETALQTLVQRYHEFLVNHSDVSIADLCFSANTGRTLFNYRFAVVGDSTAQFVERLEAFTLSGQSAGLVSGFVKPKKVPKIGFLFSGLIHDKLQLDRQLYEQAPTFRRILDRCDAIAQPLLGKSLLEILYSPTTGETPTDDIDNHTALFALQVALCELWKSWGIEPAAVMGISLGEYAAACIAGVFSLEDALKLVISGQRHIQSKISKGTMIGVFADAEQVATAIQAYGDKISICFFGGPQIGISGQQEAVDAVVVALKAQGVKTLRWDTSYAYHSPLMKSIQVDLAQYQSDYTPSLPKIPLISGTTGQLSSEAMTKIDYWINISREPVRFATAIQTMHEQGVTVFIEIGPKSGMLSMGIRCLPEESGVWLPSLRPGQSHWQQLLSSLAQLYVLGAPINWSGFECDYHRDRLRLPTYPFERQSYWLKTSRSSSQPYHSLNPPLNIVAPEPEFPLSQKKQQQPLEDYLREQIAKVLGLTLSQLDIHQPLNTLGLDSLMAIQLINRIRKDFNLEFPVEALFEDMSPIDLAQQLQSQLSFSFSEESASLMVTSKSSVVPLSFAQESFWSQVKFDPSSPFANLPFILHFTGNLDIPALERSLNELVRRQGALRTTFDLAAAQPAQIIHPTMDIPLPILDLRSRSVSEGQSLSHSEQQIKVQQLSENEAQEPFDIVQGPLLRTTLLRLLENQNILLITVHHLITDGFSMVIFLRELAAIYQAFSQAQASPLPDLAMQYADFIVWQRQWLQKEVLTTLRTYWQQQLAPDLVVPEIKTDLPRPAVPRLKAGIYSFQVSQGLSAQLKALSKQEGCTLFMLLLAAFQILVHYYTGQFNFCIGTTVANRSRAELEALIGCFINQIPIKANLENNSTFRQVLHLVRKATLEAYAHSTLPLKYILETVPLAKTDNIHTFPLPVVVIFHNEIPLLNEDVKISEHLSVKVNNRKFRGARRDLTLHLGEGGKGLWGEMEYDIDLFLESTINTISEEFMLLLQNIATNPDMHISEVQRKQ